MTPPSKQGRTTIFNSKKFEKWVKAGAFSLILSLFGGLSTFTYSVYKDMTLRQDKNSRQSIENVDKYLSKLGDRTSPWERVSSIYALKQIAISSPTLTDSIIDALQVFIRNDRPFNGYIDESRSSNNNPPVITKNDIQAAFNILGSINSRNSTRLNFSGEKQVAISLTGDFSNAYFINATILGGTFEGGNFFQTDFRGASLDDWQTFRFLYPDADGQFWNENFRPDIWMTKGSESGWKLYRYGANFTCAFLKNAKFGGAGLAGSIFIGAELTGAEFSGANITGADFTKARGVNLSDACSDGPFIDQEGVIVGLKVIKSDNRYRVRSCYGHNRADFFSHNLEEKKKTAKACIYKSGSY